MPTRRSLLVLAATIALAAAPVRAQDKSIVVASTTSTEHSGLFSHILPLFKAKTGIDVKVVAQGTGQALDTGRRGDADVVLGLTVEPATLLDRMLDAGVKLATSTPRADPSGDYAWEMFRKADKLKPGAFAALERKALQLTGGPNAPVAPAGRSIYGMLVAEGKADIFITYCTSALEAQRQNAGQRTVALPDDLAVGADYGLTVVNRASPQAYQFAMFILSLDGQRELARHGFTATSLPP